MARLKPTTDTVKELFGKSQNICAFPGCSTSLIEQDDLFIGQIAHICAANIGGPRFDPAQTDDDRRCVSNLMLLCYPHHRRVDQFPEKYEPSKLREFKKQHEKQTSEAFSPPSSIVASLSRDLDRYWTRLDHIAAQRAGRLEVAVDIETSICTEELAKSAVEHVAELRQTVSELLDINQIGDQMISISNRLQRAEILVRQLEISLLELLSGMGKGATECESRLEQQKRQLRRIIEREVVCD